MAVLEQRIMNLEVMQQAHQVGKILNYLLFVKQVLKVCSDLKNSVSKIEMSIKNVEAKLDSVVEDLKGNKAIHNGTMKSLQTKMENTITAMQDDFDMVKAATDLTLAGYTENKQWLLSMENLFKKIVETQQRQESDWEAKGKHVKNVASSSCCAANSAATTPDFDINMLSLEHQESEEDATMGAMFDDEEEFEDEGLGDIFDNKTRGHSNGSTASPHASPAPSHAASPAATSPHTQVPKRVARTIPCSDYSLAEANSDMDLESDSEYVAPPQTDGQFSSDIKSSSGSNIDTEAVTTITEDKDMEDAKNSNHNDSDAVVSIIAPLAAYDSDGGSIVVPPVKVPLVSSPLCQQMPPPSMLPPIILCRSLSPSIHHHTLPLPSQMWTHNVFFLLFTPHVQPQPQLRRW